MEPLRSFFMEDWLEQNRFASTYNLGESGGRPRTVKDLCTGSHVNLEQTCQTFLNTSLTDSPNWGRRDLREIVASFHPGATAENVLITTGTSEALFLLFRYLKPRSLALATPAFQLLYEIPAALGTRLISLPICWDACGVPFINEEEWLTIIKTKRPKCILINNPHNPSGLVLSERFIEKINNAASEIGATLIGDEHYRFLSSETEFLGPTIYQLGQKHFVTGSFIKCLGAPGLRIGWCVGPHDDLCALQNEKNYTTHTVNPLTEWLSHMVLSQPNSPLFKEMKEEWRTNREALGQFLKTAHIFYGAAPQGGLVSSIGVGNSSKARAQRMYSNFKARLKEKDVFLLPLESMEFNKFRPYTQGSPLNAGFGFRIGLGCAPQHFRKALSVLSEIELFY